MKAKLLVKFSQLIFFKYTYKYYEELEILKVTLI